MNQDFFKRFLLYLLSFISIISLAFLGSKDKAIGQSQALDIQSIAKNNFSVSADQLSEFYIMSNLANSLELPSAKVVDINYASVLIMNEIGQTAVERLEKPLIIDTAHLPRGVTVYKVQSGDTLEALAKRFKLTTTQIRWSNRLKNQNLAVGQDLLIPGTPGIVYTVKNGDTLSSIASKYSSPVEHIIAYNDLESSQAVSTGMKIILPDGQLPEKERPEYVPPAPPAPVFPNYQIYNYYYSGPNPMPWGWCTWYTWSRRSSMDDRYKLPAALGNANIWDDQLGRFYHINRSPAVGAIFQTDAGYYGHVGIVDAVNPDGTIVISDMNGIAGWGRVGRKTIGQSEWSKYKYIHGRR